MNVTKLLIATIAGFVVMFLLCGLVYMVLLKDFISHHMIAPCNIERKPPMMMYIALGLLLLAFIMSYMYPKGVETNNKIMEGFKFGAIVGILYMVPIELVMYGVAPTISRVMILMDGVTGIIIQGIGGIVIAYAYGDAAKAKGN